jgi:hypothetical protein
MTGDKLWLVYTQIVPVIFEPPCNNNSVDKVGLARKVAGEWNWPLTTTTEYRGEECVELTSTPPYAFIAFRGLT